MVEHYYFVCQVFEWKKEIFKWKISYDKLTLNTKKILVDWFCMCVNPR